MLEGAYLMSRKNEIKKIPCLAGGPDLYPWPAGFFSRNDLVK